MPIFWGHGKSDPLIKFKWGESSVEWLKTQVGIPEASPDEPQEGGILFRAYEGLDHSVAEEELDDIQKWLKAVSPDEK